MTRSPMATRPPATTRALIPNRAPRCRCSQRSSSGQRDRSSGSRVGSRTTSSRPSRSSSADTTGWSRAEQLAFWINAYNAYTIELVNKHEERASIRNINQTAGFIKAKGPWKEPIVKAGGKTYSLDEVENEIIRKQWPEPRIHFALVCAAMSCPPLRSEAYTGAKLDPQLDSQGRAFVPDPARGSRVDVKERVVYASKIFDWYKEDFGGTREAVGRFIAQYYPESPEKQLLLRGEFDLDYLTYDWTLNSRYLARLKG